MYPSVSHNNCTSCHGGNPFSFDKKLSHKSMLNKNPSDPSSWDLSCGKCHLYELKRIKTSLMYTNIGMINKIQMLWEGDISSIYSVDNKAKFIFKENGEKTHVKWIGDLDNLGAELYRKFCSRCHIGFKETKKIQGSHPAGCAMCHFAYNKKKGYLHKIVAVPSQEICLFCHNRSGRIGYSYTGLYETNNMVPTVVSGVANPASGGRSLIHIKEDIHCKAGMECVDCHTSRDIMGDGYAYFEKDDQVEISCTDCHGSGNSYPKTTKITGEAAPPIIESRNYKKTLKQGMFVVLTKKGRMYSNVYMKGKKVYVLGKRSGKIFEAPIITNTKEHTIYGHERLKCETCHSRIVPQCYGCHTYYYKNSKSYDYVKNKITPGRFLEKEDFRRAYPYILGVDKNDKIVTLTPGCETFVYVKDGDRWVKKGYVSFFKGKRQLRFAPIFSHNIRKKSLKCVDCHSNFEILGFGKGLFLISGEYKNIFLCSKKFPLDGILIKRPGKGVSQRYAVLGKGARGFTKYEIEKILKVNRCLVCHNEKDNIYQTPLDYSRLPVCVDLYIKRYKSNSPSTSK